MSWYQFKDLEVYKNYLLKDGFESLYILEDFKVDYKIIALLDVSKEKLSEGKTIVIHAELGAFIDTRTTKQIVNEFYNVNGIGFLVSKVLTKMFGITHYTPFVYGAVAYMPMTGATRNNADWIGLHFVEDHHQENNRAYFETRQGFKLWLDFPHGDLDNRIHDVALLCQGSRKIFELLVQSGNCQLIIPVHMGVLMMYGNCPCKNHLKLVIEITQIRKEIIRFRDLLLLQLTNDVIARNEMIKYHCQNLSRIKKLY